MGTQPAIVERAAQPFVGVRSRVTLPRFGLLADRLPEVLGWLGERGITATDGPFFQYEVIGAGGLSGGEHQVVAGFPVAERVRTDSGAQGADGDPFGGVLPAGHYAAVTHIGHPDGLIEVTASLLKWARAKGLEWDMTRADGDEIWGCRLESYKTDPRVEPDLNNWETELSFRLRD
ncbi:GyrI-like domain-containing protein [Streptomyces apocyni]|uniref:GyrI-like domain-containing protein n=1 Tax=Streptomyces apocyni TaxID=2654677 RepID=UPI0012EA41E1|nr:GyrI-like domain-containing protein [Streptomyces apocyni]